MMFHKSAIICLLCLPFYFINLKANTWRLIAVFSFIISCVLTPHVITYFAGMIGYNTYGDYKPSALNFPVYIIFIVLYIFFLCDSYDIFEDDREMKFFVDIYLFSLCILLFAVKNDMIYRIRLYFVFVSLPAIPFILQKYSSSRTISRLGNEHLSINNIFVGLHYLYYLFFYWGYLALLALNNNTQYIPFCFFTS